MSKTGPIRYVLFSLVFVLVIVGLVLHSYPMLLVLTIVAILLGVVADKLEKAPTDKYRHYNELHEHQGDGV